MPPLARGATCVALHSGGRLAHRFAPFLHRFPEALGELLVLVVGVQGFDLGTDGGLGVVAGEVVVGELLEGAEVRLAEVLEALGVEVRVGQFSVALELLGVGGLGCRDLEVGDPNRASS